MANAFKQPPKGPVIGPMQDFTTLPDHRKEQLGDLAQLGAEVISQPAPLDPRVSAEAQEAAEAALVEEDAPAPKKSPEEIADELEALQAVLAEDIPAEPDPIDVAANPWKVIVETSYVAFLATSRMKKSMSFLGEC